MKHSHTLSALIGTSFFAVPYLALSIPLAPSLAIAAGAFAAGELIFKVDEKLNYNGRNLRMILYDARNKNKHIKNMINKIDDKEIQTNLKEINKTVTCIIDTIERNHKKIKQIDNFFNYYLPLTIKVIDRYDEIENNNLSSKDSKKFMQSTNEMVEEINYSFKKILNKLYESDIINTDAEMKVLNSLLKADGFKSNELDGVKEGKNE